MSSVGPPILIANIGILQVGGDPGDLALGPARPQAPGDKRELSDPAGLALPQRAVAKRKYGLVKRKDTGIDVGGQANRLQTPQKRAQPADLVSE